jgi:hypothetical protein
LVKRTIYEAPHYAVFSSHQGRIVSTPSTLSKAKMSGKFTINRGMFCDFVVDTRDLPPQACTHQNNVRKVKGKVFLCLAKHLAMKKYPMFK